jgi:hypothetical protein
MLDGLLKDARLCHGVARRTIEPYPLFWHGWVEIGQGDVVVWDYQKPTIEFPKELYYAMGGIDPVRVRRYTRQQMIRWLAQDQTWGPWEYRREDADVLIVSEGEVRRTAELEAARPLPVLSMRRSAVGARDRAG